MPKSIGCTSGAGCLVVCDWLMGPFLADFQPRHFSSLIATLGSDRIDCAMDRPMTVLHNVRPAAAKAIAQGVAGCMDFDAGRTGYLFILASSETLGRIVAAFH